MGIRDILKKKEQAGAPVPEFTFIRTDTHTSEVLDPSVPASASHLSPTTEHKPRRSLDVFRSSRSRSGSASSHTSERKDHRRSFLHRRDLTSENVPADLPQIEKGEGHDAEWEARAMMLARSRPGSAAGEAPSGGDGSLDEDIQKAIRLHEEGNLEASTRLFGRLADPRGANNPLSQVLYGLALRCVWSPPPHPPLSPSHSRGSSCGA